MQPAASRLPSLLVALLAACTALLAPPPPAHAQPVTASADTVVLGLEEALARSLGRSEEVRLADSRVREARQQMASARSALFPQVNGQFSYQRTIRTPFNTGSGFTIPDSLRFSPDSQATLAERVRYLERNAGAAGLASIGSLFTGLPFGQRNTYIASVGLRQTLFSGALFAGVKIAKQFEQLSAAQATEDRLELALDVVEAYYGAVLAERLADIAAASTRQLDAQLGQVRLVRAAGNASDLDVLRVQVERQNLEPQRVEALNRRDVALLNLRRLVNVPIDQPVALADGLTGDDFQPIARPAVDAIVDGALGRRASVAAAERQIAIREQQVRLAQAAFLPSVSMTANFGAQALPSDLLPSRRDFNDDWNVGFAVQIPIFAGGQRRADVQIARAQLQQAELQRDQLRESVALELAQQRGELQRASALIEARAQTTAQADNVYQLTRLSYDRGLQTNLQLSDARLQLQQSRANEAQALHDYYLALARLLRAAGEPARDLAPARATRTAAARAPAFLGAETAAPARRERP